MVHPVAQLYGSDDARSGDDLILPVQFFAGTSDQRSEPERRLMAAVLEEAIAALLAGATQANSERRAAAREAERWFASDARLGPFAFVTICDVLGLDPDGVRRVIAIWRERRRAFRRPRLQAGRGRHQVQRPGRRRRAA